MGAFLLGINKIRLYGLQTLTKQWKKDLLRSKKVHVIEYEAEYSKAVEEGRIQAERDPKCYFVDDENSHDWRKYGS
ncbi:D-serine dehydratase [Neobacillus niacini]|nr:D-serine dehydratase [Neobacillus niacini]